jgi:hypothetical protein
MSVQDLKSGNNICDVDGKRKEKKLFQETKLYILIFLLFTLAYVFSTVCFTDLDLGSQMINLATFEANFLF